VELLVVLVVMIAIAGLVVPLVGESQDLAQAQTTRASLERLRATILGSSPGDGYLADCRRLPRRLADLYVTPDDDAAYLPAEMWSFDASTGRGWRGPYLRDVSGRYAVNPGAGFVAEYGAEGEPVALDGWGRPIVLQFPVTGEASPARYLPGAVAAVNARLISAGPDGVLQTPAGAVTPSELGAELRGDDVVLFLRVADLP
jgi:type II secretory pathway pseudopilin PulG